MNYKDVKKGSIYCVRFRIIDKGDFSFIAEAVNEKGVAFDVEAWHFNHKDAAVLIPCEHEKINTESAK